MSTIELIAVICGFLCVFLTIKENIWCWPAGLVQVSLYVFVFFEAKLYSDVILHIIYIFMNIYGWYFWLHGGRQKHEAKVTTLTKDWLTATVAGSIASMLLLGYLMANRTDASLPYGDAFTTTFSLSAQWLMSRKKLESWYFWIAVDVVAIYIYTVKGLLMTAGLYTTFLVMAIIGLQKWRQSMQQKSEIIEDPALEPAV